MRITRVPLSEAKDWKGILIPVVISPGTPIHIPTGETDVIDEVYLWAENTDVAKATVTVEFGGTGVGDQIIRVVPAFGSVQIVQGRSCDSTTGTIAVFSSNINLTNIWGYVNRIFL